MSLRIWSNCLTSWLTCWTLVPEPFAMRSRRDPLMSSGRRRSSGVIDSTIASTRSISRSSTFICESWWPDRPGSIPRIDCSGPILRSVLSCLRKSSSVNSLRRSLRSSSRASSSSNWRSAFSMSDITSPMPRMRCAMRSGWKRSSWSSFSPTLANRIGLPVTALTLSAAPPRASPSSFVMSTPSNSTAAANCSATFTASWPVIASTTSRMSCGLTALRISTSSPMSASSTCKRPAVSTMRTSLPSCLARSSAQRAMSTGSAAVAFSFTSAPPRPPPFSPWSPAPGGGCPFPVHVGPALRAALQELVDRSGAVDVARRQRDRRAVLGREVTRELGGRRRLARALEAGHQDDRRRPRREPDAHRRAAHQRRELLVDDLDDLLAGVELADDLRAQAPLLDGRRELLDDLEVHVGLEQRETDLAHGLVDVVLGQRPMGADVGERLLELLEKGVEHWIASVRRNARHPARHREVPSVTPHVRIPTPTDCGAHPGRGHRRAGELPDATPARPMRTYTATTTSTARPEAVLHVLTDPDAVARWAPVDFYVDALTHPRLSQGSRARVSGRLAGQEIGFDVEFHQADVAGLSLSADGPVALDVAYRLRAAEAGSEVSASIAVLPRRGLRARLLAEATAAVLAGGALQHAFGRIVAEAAAA